MSRVIKVFVLCTILGVSILAAYSGFDRNAVAGSTGNLPFEYSPQISSPDPSQPIINRSFGELPLYFTAAPADSPEDMQFYSVGNRYGLSLRRGGAALRLVTVNSDAAADANLSESAEKSTVDQVSLKFAGADYSQIPVGEDELAGKINYLIGNDASRWQTNSQTFAKVRYKSLYPGIDAIFYGNQRELEYDFVVAPDADPKLIALEFEGTKNIVIDKRGNLILKLENGEIVQRKPVAYQVVNGARRRVKVKFVKEGSNKIAFRLGKYEREKELIIDPVIIFSTFWGGASNDNATAVRTDAQGNIYLVGSTISPNFPVVNPLQPQIGGSSVFDAFVTKINPAGNAVIYSTYLGGSSDELGTGLSVDAAGNAVVVGRTFSSNFPTIDAQQSQLAGSSDGFVAKLNPSGSGLIFSTYLGGTGLDVIAGAKLDTAGRVVVVGRTDSTDFSTIGAYQANLSGTSLFRSGNVGGSWTGSMLAAGVNTVSSISVATTSPNIVFAATNRGVYRSSDGGTNWLQVGQSEISSAAAKVAVARSNSSVVYAIANGTVFKSINGGDDWTNVQGTIPIGQPLSLALDPVNADRVFVGGFTGTIFRTTNGGADWSNVTITNVFNNVNALVVDPANPQNVYAATSQRIYKSTIGGGSWTAIMNGIPFLQNFADLFIDPVTNTIYAAGANNLYKSTNGATNWSAVSAAGLPSVRSLAQDPSNPANLYAVTGGAFFRSLDGGMIWSQANDGLNANSLLAVGASSNTILLGSYTGTDAFVARLNAQGTALDYSTYFGGSLSDSALSIDIGGDNLIAFAGTTSSQNFPVANAVQPNIGGGSDGFVAKLNSMGSAPVYSTFLGGSSTDSATSLAIGGDGAAYVTGSTISQNFPVVNAIQSNCASCPSFINDAYLTKLNASGTGFVYSTFLGGASTDNGLTVRVDALNRVYVGGSTSSQNFPVLDAIQPTVAGGTDGFVSQIKADGSGFIYSTYYGGTGTDSVTSLTVAPEGNAVIAGQTSSINFRTVSPLQATNGGGTDAFVAKIGIAADLRIILSDDRDPVMVNNPLNLNLQISNNGPLAASNVVVTENLPAGVNFVSAVPTQGTCSLSGTTLTCQLGNIALNAQVGIRLSLIPTQTGTIINTVSVNGSEPDPSPGNNTATEQTIVSASPSIFGRVTTGDQPANDVEVKLEGLQNASTTTAANGGYSFNELPLGGNYIVRPLKAGFYFAPRSKTFNSLMSDGTADFVMSSCTYTLSTEAGVFGAAGGNLIIQLTTNDAFCTWTAVSSAPWVTITNGASGTGNGTVKISVAQSSETREAIVTIGGKVFNISQSGCNVTITPFQQSFVQAGGTGSFEVKTNEIFCQWTATPSNPWITLNGATSGNGNGVVNYTIASTTLPRAGRITVGNRNFAIYQEANYCPSPSFSAVKPVGGLGPETTAIAAGDFNSDGFADFITANDSQQQLGYFSSYLNTNGTLNRNDIASGVGEGFALVTGDFNHDSTLDFAIQGAGRIAVFQNNGAGAFTPLTNFNQAGGESSELYAKDFNQDGKTDILVGYGSQVQVYTNNGNGTFTNSFTLNLTDVRVSYSYVFADYNGDGQTDVAIGQDTDFNASRISYYFGTNTGTFVLGGTIPVIIGAWTLKAADLNSDGRADLVATGINAATVFIHLWNPATNDFSPVKRAFTETYYGLDFELADMDNDGKIDIISYHKFDGNRINIMRGNGNGTFRLPLGFVSSSYINALAFGDINRDGRLDLAFGKGFETQVASQLNQCDVSGALAQVTRLTPFDFDGDGKTDLSVFRNEMWLINPSGASNSNSFDGAQFGLVTDKLIPADYDRDGKTDLAVFRENPADPSKAKFFILQSSNDQLREEQFGSSGDIPVAGDWDGDGKADIGVYRAGTVANPQSYFYYRPSSQPTVNFISIPFGSPGDKPVVDDYDGDGKADAAVFRPSNGVWYVQRSRDGFSAVQFGAAEDKPVAADYDGDGKADQAVFRPSNGIWYIMGSTTGFSAAQFGISTDKPVPADYDGDGKTDLAVYRDGTWFILNSSVGFTALSFGTATDKPVPNSFIP